ncbi:unnamed protein product [Polarella glacialis]|uniref:Uncharacterized protein n=1 Tax=Polarella glacialis TaxID=89957 RepID=A0A813GPA7_POLGL|nr:unnamed protein product [Polarella glacialis]
MKFGAEIKFLPGFNFNCTVVGLNYYTPPKGLALVGLCAEYTTVSAGLLDALVTGCTPENDMRQTNSLSPCALGGNCRVSSVVQRMSELRGRHRQKAGLAARRLARTQAWAAIDGIKEIARSWAAPWEGPWCRALARDAEAEHETEEFQPILFALASCIQEFTNSATDQWHLYTMIVAVENSGLLPQWTYHPVSGIGAGSAGEGSPDQPTKRASVLKALLEELPTSDDVHLIAEIGVAQAGTSVFVLSHFPSLRMILVDSYCYGSCDQASIERGAPNKEFASRRLKPYLNRATQVFKQSVEAAKGVARGSLDLVFIDGDHSYEACRDDIQAWAPTVRPKGILAGHDYTLSNPGVVQAVNEFAIQHAAALHLDGEDWWIWLPAASR